MYRPHTLPELQALTAMFSAAALQAMKNIELDRTVNHGPGRNTNRFKHTRNYHGAKGYKQAERIREQHFAPRWYTLKEGGDWLPWDFGPVPVEYLSKLPVEGTGEYRHVEIFEVPVFALSFGRKQSRSRVWDCIVGWRRPEHNPLWCSHDKRV